MDADPSLLSILTDRIVRGKITIEEARDIVIRREHFRRLGKPAKPTMEEIIDTTIKEALDRNDGNVSAAARELNIHRKTIYNRRIRTA